MTLKYRCRVFNFDDFVMEQRRKYLIVVIYDITDNPRRTRLSKYLEGFGVRVQKSAFECILDQATYERLLAGIPGIIQSGDFVRVYKLTGNADIRVWGDVPLTADTEVVII
ncbi:MAG: CRISPR-associated endonuclease Cas2 [Clostridia bacterium]|nr:CRISPR-associated endonuclease Cas2 [Clostridia bacterium]